MGKVRQLREAEKQRQQQKEEEDWENEIRRHFEEEKQQRRLRENKRMESENVYRDFGADCEATSQQPKSKGERARHRMQQEARRGAASPPPPPPEPRYAQQPTQPPRYSSHQFRPGDDPASSPKSAAYMRRGLQRSMTL